MKMHGLSRGWILSVAGLAAAQAAVLHWGVSQVPYVRPIPARVAQYQLAPGTDLVRIAGVSGLSSPTLFALPDLNGFSGDAWLNYQPPVPSEPTTEDAAPGWLALDGARLGASLKSFTAAVEPSPSRIVDLPHVWVDNFPAGSSPVMQSRLIVEGEASGRLSGKVPALPKWPAADLVAPTEIQILVNGEGRVLSAVPLEGDYSATVPGILLPARSLEADRYALEFARNLSFKPLPPASSEPPLEEPRRVQSGRLTFVWATVPVQTTNAVPLP